MLSLVVSGCQTEGESFVQTTQLSEGQQYSVTALVPGPSPDCPAAG